jgi:hypothetical protein
MLRLLRYPYSPECVEGKFPEVLAALANKIVPLTGAVSFGRRYSCRVVL